MREARYWSNPANPVVGMLGAGAASWASAETANITRNERVDTLRDDFMELFL
jgi:hypothetical protein